jgi:hypothetical protein
METIVQNPWTAFVKLPGKALFVSRSDRLSGGDGLPVEHWHEYAADHFLESLPVTALQTAIG